MAVWFDVEKFSGKNDFGLWRIKMKAMLIQQGLAGALNADSEKKDPDAKIDQQMRKMMEKAHSTIILYLTDKVFREVSRESNVVGVWAKLESFKNGKPPRGKMKAMEEKFHVCRRTVSHIWAEAKQQQSQGHAINSSSKKIARPRRKRVEIDLELIASLDLTKRSTIRRIASGINCNKSTVGRWIDQGLIKAHTSALKPDLTTQNKLLRLRFCLDAIEIGRLSHNLRFKSMQNIRLNHIELARTRTSYKKVMFICTVCRPLFAEDGSILFDGKIGIFPFTEMVAAKRSSKNRVAGTLEQKPIESVSKPVMRDYFINKIVPAIIAKWPSFASKDVFVQQDNARPHICNDDLEFREAATRDGFNINIVNQSPNSPDTNINDLGFFRAIQSLQTEIACSDVDDLVNAVHKAYEDLDLMSLNCLFLSLQGCMLEIMNVKGNNCYKLPHMKKGSLMRQDLLPISSEVPHELVTECVRHLKEKGAEEGLAELMDRLGINEANMDGIEELFNAMMLLD
ncbi:uncharacterized protein LOC131008473 [Salvia miltiorrhiza]|uniref:uncharacterized protein LOC131008473 n=1 Tax=Salvia miltiorrhiza TaxID=226208 RepID=UPI0025AB7A79|nr:uncharacterized protein LOC131008473 [Salvia miltiorrhiza]